VNRITLAYHSHFVTVDRARANVAQNGHAVPAKGSRPWSRPPALSRASSGLSSPHSPGRPQAAVVILARVAGNQADRARFLDLRAQLAASPNPRAPANNDPRIPPRAPLADADLVLHHAQEHTALISNSSPDMAQIRTVPRHGKQKSGELRETALKALRPSSCVEEEKVGLELDVPATPLACTQRTMIGATTVNLSLPPFRASLSRDNHSLGCRGARPSPSGDSCELGCHSGVSTGPGTRGGCAVRRPVPQA